VYEVETSPFTKEQMDHLLRLLKSNFSFGIPSVSIAQTGSDPIALSCFLNSTPWIIDSSESNHKTNSSHLFDTYSTCHENEKVKIIDGSFSSIVGKGSIKISENIHLKFVIHVPKLASNFLSMSTL